MSSFEFHPLIQQWFADRFGQPTQPQREGWPHIAAGEHTLIAAPTGSGKTLAAFLVCIDRLWRDWICGKLADGIDVVYVSPLKALSNDIERNLQTPLAELCKCAVDAGQQPAPIRTAVRTGDTPQSARQKMLRTPPHILVTTPESLYLLLTSPKSRELLRTVRTVIVDEIHALARDKRGSHLTLSLERLSTLCNWRPTRIGLSATQRPIDQIARFLFGSEQENVQIVDTGHARDLDLAIEVPLSELSAVCSHEQWSEIYEQLVEQINSHRSTLIFVNTRRMAERIAHRLREHFANQGADGETCVAAHHGSLSRAIRLDAEQRLKQGKLKAIVATASLEMGIDIGYIDLVCQIGSPRSIATFLQRVGRSGHSLGLTPKGRLFPFTLDELIECMALIQAVDNGKLDAIEIPQAPLDILAQQIVASVACDDWDEDALYEFTKRAWPYRNLSKDAFDSIVTLLSEGITPSMRRGAYLHRDQINGKLRARRSARLAAITSGGAIPETAEYRVVDKADGTTVGSVDEDFAIESLAGDVFLLGNTSWRIHFVRNGEVAVSDAHGAPPSIPFWVGEAPGRTIELSEEICAVREGFAAQTDSQSLVSRDAPAERASNASVTDQARNYIQSQLAAVGVIPTQKVILFERFFDDSGGMQLVIHSPLGARINRAWGLALRKRFCRGFDFELQAAATDNGIVLSVGSQHSFPIETLFKMLGPHNAEHLLKQALLAAPMFQVRWRWNVTRALAVLRTQAGKKVPPHLQRFRSDDLLAAAFPETVGCLENHHGDVEIPDHPLVQQTMHDCLTEATDLNRWLSLLHDIHSGNVELVARDTREPSPFSHELLNANPYAFLDDAPLEERRTRAVATRRSFVPQDVEDLTRLDSAAIEQVRREAWPLVRDADELHDALVLMVLMPLDSAPSAWGVWFEQLTSLGRATVAALEDDRKFWIAAERWPVVRAVFSDATCTPLLQLPPQLEREVDSTNGSVEIVRGHMSHCGPVTADQLASRLALRERTITAALEALEGQGVVLRGSFGRGENDAPQWCDRRLLARIHRLTLQGLRERIKPVSPEDYVHFLMQHHRVGTDNKWGGQVGVREAIGQLQAFNIPAGVWEDKILAERIANYDPAWLDQLFLAGEIVWGRLGTSSRHGHANGSQRAITRTIPISLLLRTDLAWIVRSDEDGETVDDLGGLSSRALQVFEALQSRGALFFQELTTVVQLLAPYVEEALRELAAAGLVTSDGFSAIRSLVAVRRTGRRTITRKRLPTETATPAGRWSCFPGHIGPPPEREIYLENWCRLLLRRWGVLFRDVLARESNAPPWRDLVRMLRQMELRGQVRGGRFIRGVAGEQFADEDVVERLRNAREEVDDNKWSVISAADPLNLSGIVTDGPRVTATHKNTLILQAGRCVAANQTGRIEFFAEFDTTTTAAMRRALQTGRRQSAPHIRAAWIEKVDSPGYDERVTEPSGLQE